MLAKVNRTVLTETVTLSYGKVQAKWLMIIELEVNWLSVKILNIETLASW